MTANVTQRFFTPMFQTLEQAQHMLDTVEYMVALNKAAMRNTGLLLNSEKLDSAPLTEYAIEVMADNAQSEQDLSDLQKIVNEMTARRGGTA